MYGLPPGLRNNNPTNIRISSIPWANKIVPSLDPNFEQFKTAYDGIHAGATNLLNYHLIHGLKTVRELVSRQAPEGPPDFNNTAAYISAVSGDMAVGPDVQLDLRKQSILADFLSAIIEHENGVQPFDESFIDEVVSDVLKQHVMN